MLKRGFERFIFLFLLTNYFNLYRLLMTS